MSAPVPVPQIRSSSIRLRFLASRHGTMDLDLPSNSATVPQKGFSIDQATPASMRRMTGRFRIGTTIQK